MINAEDMKPPVARSEGLVVQELEQETLIYDLKRDKALCLNPTSTKVWKACDGTNAVSDIVDLVGDKDVVFLALDQLESENLLKERQKEPYISSTLPRRQVIKQIGLTAVVALPVIMTLVAPHASMAQSLLGTGASCTADTQCQSGRCRNNSGNCKSNGTTVCQPPGLCP